MSTSLRDHVPVNGNVICAVELEGGGERLRPSGLIEPSTAPTYPTAARVIAVSKGKRTAKGVLLEPEVKPGDLVFFSYRDMKWNENPGGSGGNYSLDHGQLFVIDQEDIMAVDPVL